MIQQSELELIKQAYALHNEKITALEKSLVQKDEKITLLEAEIARLRELLKLQQQRHFGKKSEGSEPDNAGDVQGKTITVAAHSRKKKKAGRLLSTDHLPHYKKYYELSPEEQICSCCQGALHWVSDVSTEQLEAIPTRYCIVEHIQKKYGCRTCHALLTVPKPLAPIPKSIAGASLLAEVVINKYQAHLPLYRQSKMMRYEGLAIPDNTLGNWMVAVGFGLEPVFEAMWTILKARYLQVDETPVKILEPNKKGYLWTYYAPHVGDGRGIVVFELSETRQGEVARARLETFNGLLQTDGYVGYQSLRERNGIVGLGCFTHARRRFSEIVKSSGDNKGIAAQMLEKMKPLYALEERMRSAKLSFHTRKRLRQKIARPITKEIKKWLLAVKPTVLPKSALGQAIDYTLNQWDYLVMYLRHGEAEIDTNGVENLIREPALGKKNWLFIGNKDTGKIHAIFYSFVISCILNALNPRLYIHYLISKIHALRRGLIDPFTLLPHTINTQLLEQFADEQAAFAKLVFDST